jgi:hypothetical protein
VSVTATGALPGSAGKLTLVNLDGIGATVRVYTTTMDDAGIVHASAPLQAGDLLAREHGPPLRVLCVVGFHSDAIVDYVVEVEEARLGIAAWDV